MIIERSMATDIDCRRIRKDSNHPSFAIVSHNGLLYRMTSDLQQISVPKKHKRFAMFLTTTEFENGC
ncbi:hypothetical protein EU77_00200 [Mesotoga sp. SC_NapDC]|nr:hypothetical protein EU77_00200 [Mesotoga sp. SC_NapDC]